MVVNKAPRRGQRFGNYTLIELLGVGGSAEVYLGLHVYLGTRAAVKIVRTSLQNDERDAFQREARIVAHLIHPNIVRLLDYNVEARNEGLLAFLVMDYASEGTLAQRHPRGTQVPLETIVQYVRQIASALDYAHSQRIIHRDIKPHNMLVGSNGVILLSDFGIAVSDWTSTVSAPVAGTGVYMAPEQIQGNPTFASDQYALGTVVYEWLTGDTPFSPGPMLQLIAQHLYEQPRPLSKLVPSLPQAIEAVVLRALSKDPQDRFASAGGFAEALERAISPLASRDEKRGPTFFPRKILDQAEVEQNIWLLSNAKAQENEKSFAVPNAVGPNPERGASSPTMAIPFERIGPAPTRPAPAGSEYDKSHALRAVVKAKVFFSALSHILVQATAPLKWVVQFFFTSPRQVEPPTSAIARVQQNVRFGTPPGVSALPFPTQADHLSVPRRNFFIIYHRADRFMAEWIAWHLEEAGFSTILPAWDFQPGNDFDIEVEQAVVAAERIIVILSPDYLNARDTQTKWTTVFKRDARGKQGVLLPVLVRECGSNFRKPLESLVPIDLVDIDGDIALLRLLAGVRFERSKPIARPPFSSSMSVRAAGPTAGSPANGDGVDIQGKRQMPTFAADPASLNATALLIHQIVSQVEAKLSVKYGAIANRTDAASVPNTFEQGVLAQIETSNKKQDWPDVKRKVELLLQRAPEAVTSRTYQLYARALHELGELKQARQALDQALALVDDLEQCLALLDHCVAIHALLKNWDEVVRYTEEAMQLAPGEPKWQMLQEQARFHLTESEGTPDDGDALLTIALPLDTSSSSHVDSSTHQTLVLEDIGQKARRVAAFLRTLNEKIIRDLEFRRLYGEVGSVDETITRLNTALITNSDRLKDARTNLMFYPNRRRYQEDVDDYSQGLAAATIESENLWRQFRANTLAGTTSLILQVQHKMANPDQPTSAVQGTKAETMSTRASSLKTTLNGLIQFKDFLSAAVDLDKAVDQASPVLMDSVKSTLDQLGQMHFSHGRARLDGPLL